MLNTIIDAQIGDTKPPHVSKVRHKNRASHAYAPRPLKAIAADLLVGDVQRYTTMAPFLYTLVARDPVFQPSEPSSGFSEQWTHPAGVLSLLLILGGDVIARALAQSTGWIIGPPSFSFGKNYVTCARGQSYLPFRAAGWVAYSINALISAVGENKLMPEPDCSCVVINGKTGYARTNTSWILGRMVRDYDNWMHKDVHARIEDMLQNKWDELKDEAKEKGWQKPNKLTQTGLCVSIYSPNMAAKIGEPADNALYILNVMVAIMQLGLAAIPCGIFGDWGVFMITACGILLSSVTASLPQWKLEKWACRLLTKESDKNVVLTRGNGSQHAIVILGEVGFLDLEDLAAGQTNLDVSTSTTTRCAVIVLASLWTLLLVTAAALKKNTWFLFAVGGIGIVLNIYVAGRRMLPQSNGLPIKFEEVIGKTKVMETLVEVEKAYPGLGSSMLAVFFPGKLRPDEQKRWDEFEKTAKCREAAMKK